MTSNLPLNFFTRAQAVILPHVRTEDERESLLTESFYLKDPRLFNQINRSGNPNSFCTHLIRTSLDFGCVQDDIHALALVFTNVRSKVGVDKYSEIDALITIVNEHCGETAPKSAPPPITTPPFSINTSDLERTATVFLSYSHTDDVIANQLVNDLQRAGHAVWIDESQIKGGEEWMDSIVHGINNSYAFISLLSEAAINSTWVKRELLWAERKQKAIFPVRIAECDLPIYVIERQVIDLYQDYVEGLPALLNALPTPRLITLETRTEFSTNEGSDSLLAVNKYPSLNRRALELDYLDRLQFQKFQQEQYTALGGNYQNTLPQLNPAMAHTPYAHGDSEQETRYFDNIASELPKIGRAVILGEPGAGKTWMLLATAKPFYEVALTNDQAPIPLFIKLGLWIDNRPFHDFLVGELGELGRYFDELVRAKRVIMLFDGLNEIPAADRKDKYAQVGDFVRTHSSLIILITCRTQDYVVDLNLDQVLITPLDPLRVRDYILRYLGESEGKKLFSRLLPPEAHAYEERFKQQFAKQLNNWERVFWLETHLSNKVSWLHDVTSTRIYSWNEWLLIRDHTGSLLQLARNPFMLQMLIRIYRALGGKLPENRSTIFKEFVNSLLLREGLAFTETSSTNIILPDESRQLLDKLATLAWDMQLRYSPEVNLQLQNKLSNEQAKHLLTNDELQQATRASLLTVGTEVRFTHQLLQEYFTAVYMASQIEAECLSASSIWKAICWWETTNWEAVTILLAGLYESDATPIVNWVADANPEVAGFCIERSGASTSDETKQRLGNLWQFRLTGVNSDPQPEARAAIGRALGTTFLKGRMLDQRPGVGLRTDGLPDISWAFVPASSHSSKVLPYSYHIARYPITYAQYEAFVNDGGYLVKTYWSDGGWDWRENRTHPEYCWKDPQWHIGNHPVVGITWYEASAFCRWLRKKYDEHGLFAELTQAKQFLTDIIPPLPKVTSSLRNLSLLDIRLPKEIEWEHAAQSSSDQNYPWGNRFSADCCNTQHSNLGRTTPVGIYPNGQTLNTGIHDLAGNVWEWCHSKWATSNKRPETSMIEGTDYRVLHGGSWYDSEEAARISSRQGVSPFYRLTTIGFRVVAALHSSR